MRNDNDDFKNYIDKKIEEKKEGFQIKNCAVSFSTGERKDGNNESITKGTYLMTLGEGIDVMPELDPGKKKVFFIGGSGDKAAFGVGREVTNGNKSYGYDNLKYDYVMAFEPVAWPWKKDCKSTFTISYGKTNSKYEGLIDRIIEDHENRGIYRSEVLTQGKEEYFCLLIRTTTDDGKTFDPTFLDAYFEASDSRTFNGCDIRYEREYIAVNRGKIQIPEIDYPRNWLLAGAPGTGKSNTLKKALADYVDKIVDESGTEYMNDPEHKDRYKEEISRRVTFYEEYSYENFVGCYKPVMKEVSDDETGDKRISYEFEPGPFVDIYVKAWNSLQACQDEPDADNDDAEKGNNAGTKKAPESFFLIIEEINRAKAASVFGELFQLLDRDKDGYSEYTVVPEKSLCKYLEEQGLPTTMQLPPNMYIWATMNSADQGVYPLDAAFKRRWSYKYMSIFEPRVFDPGIMLMTEEGPQVFLWESFRNKINDIILREGMDEDKCIGPYYFNDREFAEIAFYTCAGNSEHETVLKNYFSEFENKQSDSKSISADIENRIGEIINADGDDYRKSHDSPLMSKLFFYLYQDLFKYDEPEKMFKLKNKPEEMNDSDMGIMDSMSISAIMQMMKRSESIFNILNVDVEEIKEYTVN